MAYINVLKPRHPLQILGYVSMVVLVTILSKADPGITEITPNSETTAVPFLDREFLVAQNMDMIDTAIAHGSINTVIGLFEDLGMAEDLRGYGRFTLFAPTDSAFRALPDDVFRALVSDRALMARVLSYHVIASSSPIESSEVTSSSSYRTLERSSLQIRSQGRSLYVNGARVIEADIEATNGVIHIIDQVLIPSDVMEQLRR